MPNNLKISVNNRFILKITSFFLAVSLLTTTGCDALKNFSQGMGKPSATITGVHFDKLSTQGLNLVFDVKVKNPYAVPLPVLAMDYTLASNKRAFVVGKSESQGVVPLNGSKTIQLPLTIRFADVLATLANITPGSEIPYDANVNLVLDTPGDSNLIIPVKKAGKFPIPAIPIISIANINLDELSLEKAAITLVLQLKNTNQFPLDLKRMDFNLSLTEQSIIETKLEMTREIDPGKTITFKVPMSFNFANLGLAFYRTLTGNGASYRIAGDLQSDTPYGKIALPFDVSGSTSFSRN